MSGTTSRPEGLPHGRPIGPEPLRPTNEYYLAVTDWNEGSQLFGRDLVFPRIAREQPTVGSHAITFSAERKRIVYIPSPFPSKRRGRTDLRTESASSNRSHTPTQRDRHARSENNPNTVQLQAMTESMSPSSSPRLPSPPPFPEVQIGPKSPGMNVTQGIAHLDIEDSAALDSGSTRRIRRGTKAEVMAAGPPLVPLAQHDSAFQLQEYLKSLYHSHTNGPTPSTKIAITRETAGIIAAPPEGVDRGLWLYELCRLLVIKANDLIVGLFNETPACSAETCPEMRASEWQYLCAVHDPPKSCCAIDYSTHTLDWASETLSSQKYFPSRLSLGGDGPIATQQAERQITNIFRRTYRIFAHTWFQHRQLFWRIENQQGLYIFFKTVCDFYSLIERDNYTIPLEAEGIATSTTEQPAVPKILKKQPAEAEQKGDGEDVTTTVSTGATARRHKHTPSTGSAVTTIAEGDDEDDNESNITTVRHDDNPTSQTPDDSDDVTIAEPIDVKTEPQDSGKGDQATEAVKEEEKA